MNMKTPRHQFSNSDDDDSQGDDYKDEVDDVGADENDDGGPP